MRSRPKWYASQVFIIATFVFSIRAYSESQQPIPDWADVLDPGATFSVYSYGQAPYNRSAPFLSLEERILFSDGSEAFNTNHQDKQTHSSSIIPSASANAQSCENCHFKNGRGRTHLENFTLTGFSVTHHPGHSSPSIVRKVHSEDNEAILLSEVRWLNERQVELPGGEIVTLIRPIAIIDGIETSVDLRNGPGVYGLGLLEAIADAEIVAYAKSQAYEQYGIRGLLPILEATPGIERVGRFGWKASHATLLEQVRSAARIELGIIPPEPADRSAHTEYSALMTKLTNYMRLLAVPTRRLKQDGAHRLGAVFFEKIGCAMCHRPSWKTANNIELEEKYRSLQIYPFTDLLLHDMGPELSDTSGTKLSRFWRTPSLWGIGVQQGVSANAGFLHDGRARTLTEAILWHGGEAKYAVDNFKAMAASQRAKLLTFLSSL